LIHLEWCRISLAVATLADLSLLRRVGAVLGVLELYPSLDVPQRHELLFVALWPSDGTTVPGKRLPVPRPCVSPRERAHAVDLVVRLHLSEEEVASRYDVTPATVREWCRRAAL
jgi:hypothetical protein